MNETQQLELYLSGALKPKDQLLMEARLLIDLELKEKLQWQQTTYTLIKAYGRKNLRMEIEKVQNRMFTEKKFEGFRQKIKNIFR